MRVGVATVPVAVAILCVTATLAAPDRCGPYLRDFYCGVACSPSNGFTGSITGRLTCACLAAPTAHLPGNRNCNTLLPQAFGPGVPSFSPLADGDALDEFTLSGFKEIRLVQSDAFFHVGCRLKVLRLTSNGIERLERRAFAGLVALRLLNLSANALGGGDDVTVAVPRGEDTPSLETLDLSHNDIASLGLADFSTLTRLKRLEFHHNRALTIAGETSPHLVPRSLRQLSIGYGTYSGSLAACDFHILFRVLNLTSLSLAGISWRCDCDIVWLRLAYETHRVVESVDGVQCDDCSRRRRSMRSDAFDDCFSVPVSEHDTSACGPTPEPEAMSQRCPVAFPNYTSSAECAPTDMRTSGGPALGTTATARQRRKRPTTAYSDEPAQRCRGSVASWGWSAMAGCAFAAALAAASGVTCFFSPPGAWHLSSRRLMHASS